MSPSKNPVSLEPTGYVSPDHLTLANKIIRKYQKRHSVHLHGEIRSAGFFGLSKALSKFDKERGLTKAFVGQCVRNTIYDALRSEQSHYKNVGLSDEPELHAADWYTNPFGQQDELLHIKRIVEMAQALPTEGPAMELTMQGYTHKEIGKKLGLSKNGITTRYHKAVKKLRLALGEATEIAA